MRYKNEEKLRLKSQIADYILGETSYTNKRISELTGVTQKTVGIWALEIKRDALQRHEVEIQKEISSIEIFISNLHKAKKQFIKEVNEAIKNYITFNQYNNKSNG